MDARAIGVFDSGVGGLTVAGSLVRAFPQENIVYLGDTARLPYGAKSPDVVTRYSERCAQFLLTHDLKLLVIACNTASAFALEHLQRTLPIPVLGVIEPGAQKAVLETRTQRIGVIGTHGTVKSGAYTRAIQALRPDAYVVAKACPLFVPLAEEAFESHQATRLIAEEYLAPLRRENIDTLVLGCTHYPLLKSVIADAMPGVTLCDSASTTADAAEKLIARRSEGQGKHSIYLTDIHPTFANLASRFFGAHVASPQRVDL